MIYTTDEIRQHIIPIAEKYQLRSVYIFGSYARNEATDNSDLDILVDTTNSKVKGWVVGGLYSDLCAIFKHIDLVTTNAILQNDDDRLAHINTSIIKDRVLIYEQQ